MKQNTFTADSGKPVVIYHKNCMDGLGAAYAFFHKFGHEYEYFPGVYNEPPPPNLEGRNVFLVDFSYSREVIESLLRVVSRLTVIDHHKTAIDALVGLEAANFFPCLSNQLSGAGLAWRYVHTDHGIPLPEILQRIQDRDLWLFSYKDSKAVHAYLASQEWTLEKFHDIIPMGAGWAAARGSFLLEKNAKDVKAIIEATKRMGYIDGHYVPIANVPPWLASDVGNIMSAEYEEGRMFSASYYDTDGYRIFSLRSADNGMDVSAIAKKFGGGGHYHAAGFRLPQGFSPIIDHTFNADKEATNG